MPKPVKRCSELDRELTCYGSATLAELVNPPPRADGIEGSVLHWMIAKRLAAELGASGDAAAPWTPPGWKLPQMSEWIVGYCFREVRDRAPEDWSLEVEVGLAYSFDAFDLSGHIDALAVNPDGTEAIFADYKTGYDPVDAAECNEQVLGYMVLLKLAYPDLRKAIGIIIQPRNNEEEGFQRVSEVTVEGADRLDDCVQSLASRVTYALQNPMLLDTGRKQCRFCPAQIQCPALRELRRQMKLLMTPEQLAVIAREPNDAILGDMIVECRVLNKPLETAEALLHSRLDSQPEVVAGNGVRITRVEQDGGYDVKEPKKVFGAFIELVGQDAAAEALGYPSGKIKDTLAEKMGIKKGGKGAVTAESVFDAKLAIHMERKTRRVLKFS